MTRPSRKGRSQFAPFVHGRIRIIRETSLRLILKITTAERTEYLSHALAYRDKIFLAGVIPDYSNY